MSLLTPAQLERVNVLVGQCLRGRTEITLGDLHRDVSNADRATAWSRRVLSVVLRKRGFVVIGTAGAGYEREPLYAKLPERKVAA